MRGRKSSLLLAAIVLLPAVPGAAAAADYEITVTLDAEQHGLQGRLLVRWFNTTDAPTDELWWHLYLNAFANDDSSFLRELGRRRLRFGRRSDDMSRGWTRITRMTLADGRDLLPALEFMRPDDGNPEDFTVARVRLPEEIPPGGSVAVQLEFEAQLPSIIARTGFAGDFHLVGQWFPKLGVFEGSAGWDCHQYHANSEYFADFGSYRVTLELPAGWIVGATGVETSRVEAPGGASAAWQVTYAANRVHDFAWMAAPSALMEVIASDFEPGRDVPRAWLERAMSTLDRSAAELELPPCRLRLLLPRSQLGLAERHLRAARFGLAWFGLWYGPYPYPELTIVVPPISADEAGGMEYPTFVTGFAGFLTPVLLVHGRSLIETVVIHEIGHQYFYGLLASNEFEEAWLDEGLTSYAELQCMDAIAADGLSPELRRGGFWTRERLAQSLLRSRVRIDQPSWQFQSPSHYFSASYGKTALSLRTLEGLIGPGAFARAIRRYAGDYRFRHPTGDDFFAAVSEAAGEELGWFFEQAFRSDVAVDWAVLGVRQRGAGARDGMVWDGVGWEPAAGGRGAGEAGGAAAWSIEVDLGRRGDFAGPVEVELRYEDGSRERRRWDGAARWVRWTIDSGSRLDRVAVDPDGVWALETRRSDNYWARETSSEVARRSLWWVPEALHWLGLALLPWS